MRKEIFLRTNLEGKVDQVTSTNKRKTTEESTSSKKHKSH